MEAARHAEPQVAIAVGAVVRRYGLAVRGARCSGSVAGNVGFFAASDAAIATKRLLLNDFLLRLARAKAWARTHPRDYAAVLAKETGLPFEVALFSVQSNLGTTIAIDDKVVADQQAIFERYRDAGIISSIPDVKWGYDPSFSAQRRTEGRWELACFNAASKRPARERPARDR